MSAVLELKKTETGELLARRKDGKPLTAEDRQEAKRLASEVVTLPRAWIAKVIRDGETLRAVLISSAMLNDLLWLIIDRSFQPTDGSAIYYADELPELSTKTVEELRQIHRTKLTFPGCRVIQ